MACCVIKRFGGIPGLLSSRRGGSFRAYMYIKIQVVYTLNAAFFLFIAFHFLFIKPKFVYTMYNLYE